MRTYPPQSRETYGKFFDALRDRDASTIKSVEQRAGLIAAGPSRRDVWATDLGEPVASGLGIFLFDPNLVRPKE